ncbi:MAG TPA: biopolymer transporter ExbD [Gemmata sp.]|nr:biopolymer transporter ExbD [Gemmata sp.]
MSHGSADKCEPNFTPLLDLVLQLVMFFMLCANFVMEQTSDLIALPVAISARALDKGQDEVIYLNVNEKGQVIKPPSMLQDGDSKTWDNPIQVETYMRLLAKIEMERTKKARPEATIILRIDKGTAFGVSYPIMKACRSAGFTRVELRAIRYSGEEK